MKFRKITAIGLALCMSAAITACGSNNTHKETVNTESVATTATSRTETDETKKTVSFRQAYKNSNANSDQDS